LVLDRQQRIDAGLIESGMMCNTICDLNTITAGLQPGWLTILAGRPAMGKTAVATSAAIGYAKAGHGVGFISLEMDSLALGQRIAADMTHMMGNPVAYPAIREGRLIKLDLDHVLMARDAMAKLPLRMVDVSRMTLSRVAASVKRMKARMAAQGQKLEILFIDYLTLIDPDTPSKNRSVDVGTISRGLKALAKQEQISIIALAQLNRGVEAREDKRPNLSDLRDSGEIEQDADNVIFLYRDEYYLKLAQPDPDKADAYLKWQAQVEAAQGRIEFIAAKVRAGEARTCKGFFFGQNQAVRGSDFYGSRG
jgi:replicative DNA helicase